MKLKAALRAIQPVGQTELAEVVSVEVAMKGDIVNREERPRTGKRRVAGVNRSQIRRHEAGHPVVQMDDVERFIKRSGEFDDGATEEGKTLGIVRLAVQPAA